MRQNQATQAQVEQENDVTKRPVLLFSCKALTSCLMTFQISILCVCKLVILSTHQVLITPKEAYFLGRKPRGQRHATRNLSRLWEQHCKWPAQDI